MTREHVLALDEGTTGVQAMVFDAAGAVAGAADQDFQQHYPKPGWVEHDAEAIWKTTVAVARRALDAANVDASGLAAVGITNQRETTLLWDRHTGAPIHNALVWQDRRTAPLCDALVEQGLAGAIREKTGLVVDAYFSGTKAQWLLDNVPGARERAERGELAFGTMDSWLIWKLTGGDVHATDVTNASRTMLYDIDHLAWDTDLLEAMDVPHGVLPEVVASSGVLGHTTGDALGAEVPISGVAGDQQAALFGQACFREGMAKSTYGTGSFLLMNTGAERVETERLITTVAWTAEGRTEYALEGSIFVTGAAVQWLRDGLGVISDAAEVEALASEVDDTGGVHFVPALTGLGAPHWDMRARGAIVGLTRGSTKAHIARATLEAAAFQTVDVAQACAEDSGVPLATLRVDGGMTANDLLMQTQADLLGAPVERPAVRETTALGAAYLAGLGAGVWASRDEVAKHWRLDARFDPAMDDGAREARLADWRRAVDRARDWARDEA